MLVVGLGRRSASLIALAHGARSRTGAAGWCPPFIGATGVLYTIPSLAFFFLLLPITGRGTDTAIIALTAYTLQIIYRNIVAGLANVPARRQGRRPGHGDDRPPAAVAGRAAARGAGDHRRAADRHRLDGRDRDARGLRRRRRPRRGDLTGSNITFKTGVVIAGGLAIGMAIAFDVLLLVQRRLTRWSVAVARGVRPRVIAARSDRSLPLALASSTRSRARSTSSSASASRSSAAVPRSAASTRSWELTLEHIKVSGLALAVALALALPLGLLLGHRGKGELLAVAVGNAGRAIPELALIAFMVAFVGVGLLNVDDRADGPRASRRSSPTPSSASARSTAARSRRRGEWG